MLSLTKCVRANGPAEIHGRAPAAEGNNNRLAPPRSRWTGSHTMGDSGLRRFRHPANRLTTGPNPTQPGTRTLPPCRALHRRRMVLRDRPVFTPRRLRAKLARRCEAAQGSVPRHQAPDPTPRLLARRAATGDGARKRGCSRRQDRRSCQETTRCLRPPGRPALQISGAVHTPANPPRTRTPGAGQRLSVPASPQCGR